MEAFTAIAGLTGLSAVLNVENGLGVVSLSAHWQSVIRGAFLVVVVQSRMASRRLA